jgi:hypothetical protein
MTKASRKRIVEATAHHEAGHAVVAWRTGLKFKHVTIVPSEEGDSLGHVLHASAPGWFRPDVELSGRVRLRIERHIVVGFAGQLAEAKFRGKHPSWGMESDDQNAIAMAFHLPGSKETVNAYLSYCWHASRDLVSASWRDIQIDSNVGRGLESLLANEDPRLIRLLCDKAKGVRPAEVRASLKRAKIRIDFPVPAISTGTTSFPARSKTIEKPQRTTGTDVTLSDLIQAGLIKAPLRIERQYKGVHLTGLVRPDGKVEFDGQAYDSLSTAAGMARKSVVGAPAGHPYLQTNGWSFWQYADDDGGRLREIDHLRQAYAAQRKLKVVSMG